MFLGCKILILPKSNHFIPNFALFCLNLTNQFFPKKDFATASPAPAALTGINERRIFLLFAAE